MTDKTDYINKKYPRLLIVSHNALSDTQSNGKTISAFFRSWDSQNLAQLYLTTDVPHFTVCQRFFQIHDFDMLKRALFNKQVQGRMVKLSDLQDLEKHKAAVTSTLFVASLKKMMSWMSPLFRLMRDILWKIGDCKTAALIHFLDDFKPQAVFFQSSSGVFAFSLVKWICERYQIPLIMQTTDDYVTHKITWDPFSWIQCARLTRCFRWAVSRSICVISIGEKMAKEYQSRFGGSYYVAMNCVESLGLPESRRSDTVRLLYAGNLGLNRWRVLGLISQCLEDLFVEAGLKAELQIYSLIPPGEKELKHLHRPPYSFFNGALDTAQLNEEKTLSDILVHVEAFDRDNRHVTRLSISTKIPEYLASGRCIFAVGPSDVASMEYIAEHDLGVAVMSDDKSQIKQALREIMTDAKKRSLYARNGLEVAARRHNRESTAEDICGIIRKAIHAQV